MKTRIFLLALSMMFAVTLQAQTYDQLWKRVQKMEQKDLPKSVIAEAQAIYQKAKAEQNVPQMMKAYLTMMAYRGSISPDSLAVDVKGLEDWAASSKTQTADRAVLYSILGEMKIKEDFEKGNEYLHLSLKDRMNLVDYSAEKLVPMVETGETSRLYFANNLYDLVARRAIRLWNENLWNSQREVTLDTIRQTYQTLLDIYKEKGMRSAWLLTALDAYPQADEAQLREWIKEYGDLEVCAEVYLRLSQWMMMREDEPAKRLALLREGISRYPKYSRINALKNEEKEILAPRLSMSVDYAYPERPMDVKVNYRNIGGFTFRIYRLNLSAESPSLSKVNPQTVHQYGALLREEHISLPATPDYRGKIETVKVEAPQSGIYYLMTIPDGHASLKKGALLQLTSLMLLERGLPSDRQEVVVLDRESGHPVPHATVAMYTRKNGGFEKQETYVANADGVVMLTGKGDQNVYWNAYTEADVAMPILWNRFQRIRDIITQAEEYTQLFTDRAIYRPGQTVRFSGMIYVRKDDSFKAQEGRKLSVSLLDAEGRKVVEQEVTSDTFGTFQGTFELPKSGKLGVYRIRAGKGMTTIRVEEYKRPTFDVTFEGVEQAYQAGDSIKVVGIARSFSGAPIQGAKVKYSVECMMNRFWRMQGTAIHQKTGEGVTDAQGRFEVPVHFLPVSEDERYWYYTYRITADVTSLAGETQEGRLDLPLGSASLRVDIPEWDNETVVKEEGKTLKFVVSNLKNVPVKAEVSYQVYTVTEGADGKLQSGKCIWQGTALANQPFVPDGIYAFPSGRYQLQASVKDEAGRTCEQTITFVLFSLDDKKLPYETEVWNYQTGNEFDSDGKARVYFGSKEKDVCLFYDVYSDKKWIESKRIQFSDSLLKFSFQYREEYGDGILVSFIFAKNGQLYARYVEIKKPKPDKALQLKWKTFRDKLQPGQKETWTLSVLRPDGKPVDAQLMATLYDASLDQVVPHQWRFALHFPRYIPTYYWGGERARNLYWGFSFPINTLKYQALSFSVLDVPVGVPLVKNGLRMYKASTAKEEAVVEMKYVPVEADMEEESVTEEKPDLSLRSDFAETAFFYPQLRTDAHGEVNIEFTLPESLTGWKFMGLAHTRDMDYGSILGEVVASKEFMLQPNLPRFVRIGDEVDVAASLINLSDKEIQGAVRMELLDPETEKVVLTQKRPFVVKASETSQVSFRFEVSDKYEGLVVRMIADGGSFSDGEQRYLPVLSNKQRLTESVLLNVNGKGTYIFSLESLFNHHSKTVSRPKMMVEFTGNPLWYAIQALKVMENPESDNALSWTTAFYANSLLAHLARTELRLADSLKLEGVEGRIAEAVMKLSSLQGKDGAWSWYKGMSGSRYMTTQITELIARLRMMTGSLSAAEVVKMYREAWKYLGKEVSEEVLRMKEQEKMGVKNLLPSEQAIQYLYIGALDKELTVQSDVKKYLLDKLTESSRALTIYGKALVAIIMKQSDKMDEADEFLQSIMEYSVMSEEMGRYFDTPKAEYSWFSYKIPTQVAAIEAVRLVANEEKTQEEMKQWLLKQKQAQAWDTPIATADAVYALLTTGKDWLQHTGATEIKVGKEVIRTPDDALGFVEKKVSGKVMGIRQVTVEKKTDGVGWGAVYAEFEENLDKVTSQGSALKVNRTLYKNGQLLSEGAALQVGDKLTIRLAVTADRDMDFVQVTDARAACMEPVDALSGYRWNQSVGYYQETKDATSLFYMDRLRKGTHVLEYDVYVTSSGRYAQGIVTARSVYAPEFVGHGEGGCLWVK